MNAGLQELIPLSLFYNRKTWGEDSLVFFIDTKRFIFYYAHCQEIEFTYVLYIGTRANNNKLFLN